MARYLALATVVVLLAIGAILALPHVGREAGRSVYHSQAAATPGPPTRGDGARDARAVAVTGDAPWALSALPGCFHQVRAASGNAAFVRAHLPPGAQRVRAEATLVTRDCRLRVGADDAVVSRADNVLHIPRPASLFVSRKRLLLLSRDGQRWILRTYVLASGLRPTFE